ncbi:MAG: hypothetical protein V8R81_08665 [Clostridia bacterium]|jgi:hypothetical protein
MGKEYYVILDKIHLNFMNDGIATGIEGADKFYSYESAKKELMNDYDEDFEGVIYKVTEKIFRDFELVEESEENNHE